MFNLAQTSRPAARLTMALSTAAGRATAAILARGTRVAVRVSNGADGDPIIDVTLPAEYADGVVHRRCVVHIAPARMGARRFRAGDIVVEPDVNDGAYLHALARAFVVLAAAGAPTDRDVARRARLALLRARRARRGALIDAVNGVVPRHIRRQTTDDRQGDVRRERTLRPYKQLRPGVRTKRRDLMNSRHYIYAAIVQLRAFGPTIVCEARAVSGDHDRLGVRPDPMRGTYTAHALRRGDRPRKSEIVLPAGEAATQVALDDALATWAIARLAVSPVVSEGGALGGAAVLDALVAWIGADLAPAHSKVVAPCRAGALIAIATREGEGATTKATRAGRRRRGKRGGRKHHRGALDFNAALAQFVEAHGLVQDRPGHFAAAHRTAG